MKKYLIKILSVILACWMVVITGGLHLYAHNCGCCDVQEISLNDFDECCTKNDYHQARTETEENHTNSCCGQSLMIDLVEGESCSTDNCCDVTHSYLKIDDSFNKAGNLMMKSFPVFAILIQLLKPEIVAEQYFQKLLTISNSSPHGFTGKLFLIFAHQLKIPISL